MRGDPRRYGIDDGTGPTNDGQDDEPHPDDLCHICGEKPGMLSRDYDAFEDFDEEELTQEVCRECYKALERDASRNGVEAAATSAQHHSRSQEEFVRSFMFQQGWAMDAKKEDYEMDPDEDEDEKEN